MVLVEDILTKISDLIISTMLMNRSHSEYRLEALGQIFSTMYRREISIIYGPAGFSVYDNNAKKRIFKLRYEPTLNSAIYVTDQGTFIRSLAEDLEELNSEQLEKIYFLLFWLKNCYDIR